MYLPFYQKYLKVYKISRDEIRARCPFPDHNDKNPSFSANIKSGKFICFGCGKTGNASSFAIMLKIPRNEVPGDDSNYRYNNASRSVFEKSYDYVDEDGTLLFQVCRCNPKIFFQRKPDGKGGWTNNTQDVRRVLYRLPEIIKADKVIIVEGEKDVDNLFKAGFIATTNQGGAGRWKPNYNQFLKNKEIVIIPDNDTIGKKHAQDVADSLIGITHSVKIIPLPNSLGKKADVSDFLEKYGPEKLQLLINSEIPELELHEINLFCKEINDFDMTDDGNAQLLCKLFSDKIRYQRDTGKWFRWNGFMWQPDELGKINQLPILAAKKRLEFNSSKSMKKYVNHCGSNASINACLKLTKNYTPIATNSYEFNKNPMLLGCSNGILDLRTGKLINGLKCEPVSMSTNITFDENAKCPRFEQFLKEIFNGDKEIINFIKTAVGYSITGDVTEQCLFLLFGKGSNGKSTFTNTLHNIIGEYADVTPFNTLLSSANDATRIPTDIADLNQKRFVIANEIKENSPLNEERIKSLTGGDPLKARKLYQDNFKFIPTFKLWLAVNHKPQITDRSEGLWRRINLIPFNQTFSGSNRDNDLYKDLLKESSGILNLIISGCLDWQRTGLIVPKKIQNLTQEYRKESNIIEQFLTDVTVKNINYKINASDLYKVFEKWSKDNNLNPMTQTSFGRRMTELGFEKVKNGTFYYLGLRLTDD